MYSMSAGFIVNDTSANCITIRMYSVPKSVQTKAIAKIQNFIEGKKAKLVLLKDSMHITHWEDEKGLKNAMEAVAFYHLKGIADLKTKELVLHKALLEDLEELKQIKEDTNE